MSACKVSAQIFTHEMSIRSCYVYLFMMIVQASYKPFPSGNILYFIKIIGIELSINFMKDFIGSLEIFHGIGDQPFIVKIEIETWKRFSQLFQQCGFTCSSHT